MLIPELEGKMSSHEFSEQIAYDRAVNAIRAEQEQLQKQRAKNARHMGVK